ncbi:hypothetical protein CYLTODRAFT_423771 [Cylindrobasidium torrendii FP15055 ss-10]|uniref:Uncharacterized protein n=1 Tax=Cylindrobasidium torrendii FP15055 ss-10 TaxID=1314674 RepID=A0A0D7B739_9AGAR|nr:hypothetical protein CYLTODRAFT_423771 [Cylindrobasidium torrendii FP15055 ss-10]
MSSGVLVDVPAEILAVNDPAAFEAELVARFQAAVEKDPQGCIDKLSEHLKDEKTRQRMEDEAKKGLDAIRAIRDAFGRVTDLLSKIDAKEFKGMDGKTIRKFEPEWDTFRKTFNDNLLKTEGLATAARASIDSFCKGILPLLEMPAMDFAEKSKNIDAFVKNIDSMEKAVCVVEDLVKSYQDLSAKVTVFRNTFVETMDQVGQHLEADIKRVQEDIDRLNETIARHKSSAKNFAIAAGASGVVGIAAGIGACFVATGILAPLAIICIGAAVLFGISAADEYFNKLKQAEKDRDAKQAELDALKLKRDEYQKLRPDIDNAVVDMGTISEKLLVLTTVFKTIRNDALKVKLHLQNSSNAEQPDFMKKTEIGLTAQSYANLQVILDAFAAGWEDSAH